MNGALYLTEMDATGARGDLNAAGAGYGTGYCDAQCPVAPLFPQQANLDAKGACCHEMDLWEANSRATTFTPHVCSNAGMHACASVEDCGSLGACDKSGCQYNNYQLGNKTFYGPGPGFTLDTTRPLTVTTQFLNDSWGGLNEIRRLYVQGGRVLANAAVNDPYWPPGDSIKMSHCQARSDFFEELGGLRQMGRALDRGMVLVFRLWSDPGQFMNWLDAGEQGPCSFTEGDPADILRDHGDTAVTFSNIRWGELESTYKNSTG
ncbi:concanavalin A-like lectin/glucanase [Xylariomycetidae sp. FL0641]|nr:concanavalin A-like lectin/glucanase [Xylariomycetidae sp. FL0641]